MKKMLVCCLLSCLMLLTALPALASDALPAGVREALGPVVVTSSACWEDPGHTTWFALALSPDNVSTLHCFTNAAGVWAEAFSTHRAVPQGNSRVDLHISEGAWAFTGTADGKGQYLAGPILIILQYGADSDVVRQMINFQRSDAGVWRLIALNNYPESAHIRIGEEALTYYAAADKGQTEIIGTVPCCIERDLRLFSLPDFPLTFLQAKEMLRSGQ